MWKGAIFSFLRFNRSLPRHASRSSQLTFNRYLNVSQTAEALRPFLFAVHPDFFGQHPKERATNEHSLKQLYAYIDGLRCEHHQVRPVDLTFYLRDHAPEEEEQPSSGDKRLRPVNISLLSRDVYKTVTHILQSCDLSTDHVRQSTKHVQYGNSRSTQEASWDTFFYDYVEKAMPKRQSATFSKDDTDIPLCLWMKLNLDPAHQKMVSTQPIRDEADHLQAELNAKLGLQEISWKCQWDINNFRSCLRILRDLVVEYPDIFQNLKGGKLVFGHSTRLSYEGKAVLGHRDIPQYWLGFVNNLSKYFEVFGAISSLEEQISSHLGGVQVCRQHLDKAPFKAYYQVLVQMLASLNRHKEEVGEQDEATGVIPPKSLSDVEIQIINGSRPPLLSPSGKIYISHTSPPSALMEFLLENQEDARRILQLNRESKAQLSDLIQQCKKERQFAEFSKKDTVTDEEMRSCCRRLLDDPTVLGMDLSMAKIRVGLHYNLLGSGEMCIPWNWK